MATPRFDSISKFFARRKAVAAGVIAQEATPTASSWDGEKIPYLFVQSFEGGSIAPKEGEDGTFTITLEHGLGQTLYFADRPSRDVGAVPTLRFLSSLGFPDDNPPNAAIVVDDGNGGTDIAVVELRNPLFDPTGPGVIYDVTVLENWEDTTELGLQDAPADLSNLPTSFGPTHLFIDDCGDDYVTCTDSTLAYQGRLGPMGFCYNYAICMPCEPWGHTQPGPCATRDYWSDKCNASFSSCGDSCFADYVGRTFVCNGLTD
jgi:hypothetical protein